MSTTCKTHMCLCSWKQIMSALPKLSALSAKILLSSCTRTWLGALETRHVHSHNEALHEAQFLVLAGWMAVSMDLGLAHFTTSAAKQAAFRPTRGGSTPAGLLPAQWSDQHPESSWQLTCKPAASAERVCWGWRRHCRRRPGLRASNWGGHGRHHLRPQPACRLQMAPGRGLPDPALLPLRGHPHAECRGPGGRV